MSDLDEEDVSGITILGDDDTLEVPLFDEGAEASF
jgi:hypothetical protein